MSDNLAIQRLLAKIDAEEDRVGQHAQRVRISRSVALDLTKMTAEDWYSASKGFTDIQDFRKLSEDFFNKGISAAHGLKLSVVGPVLELSISNDAPDVEIIEGTPYA